MGFMLFLWGCVGIILASVVWSQERKIGRINRGK
jgi:hypothetical protein